MFVCLYFYVKGMIELDEITGYTKYAYLQMTNATDNNNKFYIIYEMPDRSIEAIYGRVGTAHPAHKHYESWEKDFYSLKDSKERKGYKDVTALHSNKKATTTTKIDDLDYKPVDDKEVHELITQLIKESRDFMARNYEITAEEITQKLIDETEDDLSILANIASTAYSSDAEKLSRFNIALQTLMTDNQRKMNKVADHLATSVNDFADIIEREQDMLDNLKGQMQNKQQNQQITPSKQKDITVLEAKGLQMRPVTYKEEDQILAHLGRDYHGSVERRYVRGFAVENAATRQAYEKFKADNDIGKDGVKLFYHGSKVENWYSIMKQGLSLNPNASVTGKMFGNGLYFASECRKSLNYMDTKHSRWNNGNRDSGYTAIYAVALGKCYMPTGCLSSSFDKTDVNRLGYDSVYAEKSRAGLQNDEYVVYDASQCTIKYLCEFTEPYVRELSFNCNRDILRNNISKGFKDIYSLGDGKMSADLCLENLPDNVRDEFMRLGFDDADMDKVRFIFYPAAEISGKGRIEFEKVDIGGNTSPLSPNLTGDDKAFLMRETKKVFCESEREWQKIVEKSRDIMGKKVCEKPEEHKKHKERGR